MFYIHTRLHNILFILPKLKTMIHYSRSFRQFLAESESKVAKILWRLNNKPYRPIMLTNAEIDYITFRKDGTISYLPAGKEHRQNDDGEWEREGRQNGRPAKVIRKLFHPRVQKFIKDVDFEAFSNAYKANFSDDGYEFTIHPNTKVKEVYDMERLEGDGSLNGSCMNGDVEYLDIYENCKQLRIVTLTNKDGLLCGRALLWNISDEITFLDRFYVVKDFMYDMFKDFAKDNGFWYKYRYMSYDDKSRMITPDGDVKYMNWTIRTNTDFDYYPYIDTFQFGNDGTLTNCSDETMYCYSNTGGDRQHTGTYDEINDCYIDQEDAIYIESGDRCYRDRTTHVDNCVNIGDSWYHEDDSNIVKIGNTWYEKDSDEVCVVDGEFCLMDDCVFSDFTDEYHLSDDCVYSDHHGTYIPNDDAVEIFGKYYHKNDVNSVS